MKKLIVLSIFCILFLLFPLNAYAWWNITFYPYRYKILSNATLFKPISINDTYGINSTSYWSLNATTNENVYVYCQYENCTLGLIAIANNTDQKNWERSDLVIGNNPTAIYDSNYKMWLHLDDLATNITKDSTSNSNNGNVGTFEANDWLKSVFSYGLNISAGVDDILNVSDNAGMETANGTLEVWVKRNSPFSATNTVHEAIVDKGSTYFGLRWREDNGALSFLMWDGSSHELLSNQVIWSANTWYYIVVTWGSNGQRIYINGVLESSNSDKNYYSNTNDNWFFGGFSNGGSKLNGLVDEIRFSNIERNLTYIQEQYWNGINNLTKLYVPPPIPPLPSINVTYSYNCSGNYSLEWKIDGYTVTSTGLYCPFGCSNDNPPNFVSNRIPQGDICNIDSFRLYTYAVLGFFGILIVLGIIKKLWRL